VDPLAGSYYVESLTDAIEKGARELIGQVDELGGAARAIERGFFQDAIARSAYDLQRAQEDGGRVVVGVNQFTDDSPPLPISTPDFSALEQQQKSRLAEIKQSRNASAASTALAELSQIARGQKPLMPAIIAAVRRRATLGEISDTLRAAWGVYRPT
jgi:methylmalonyl-CoA mutase N-terminal domain/subunit